MTPSDALAQAAGYLLPHKHCLYCGARCRSVVCPAHSDLPANEPVQVLREPREPEAAA